MKEQNTVKPEDMEMHLEALFRQADPTEGLFGSDSMMWRVGRESSILLGGGRAALLQLAHPYIAHAIDDHSTVLTDIQGRFRRTMSSMFALTFGDRAEALRLARKIYAIHRQVNGTLPAHSGLPRAGMRYSALERSAMFWVAATLWDTSILIFEAVIGPLTPLEKERYYQETVTFCRLFGIPAESIPADWRSFRCYFDEMVSSNQLFVGETARTLGQRVLRPPRRLATPLYHCVDVMTAGLMPPALRTAYDIPYERRHRLAFDAGLRLARRTIPALPDGIRFSPAYLAARRRIRGEPGHDRIAAGWKRFVLGLLRDPGRID